MKKKKLVEVFKKIKVWKLYVWNLYVWKLHVWNTCMEIPLYLCLG